LQTENDQPSSLQHYEATKTHVSDDFALFMTKKRKEDGAPEDHSSKKNKPNHSYDEQYVMIQDN